ncbi:MAG: 3-dehydroquinate synthase [Nitrospirota bacterium]|nr:3-dehydroquinate synthase [Nitrospirota bacterium]
MDTQDTHRQKFSVSYEYPVIFTTDVFALDNTALLSAISYREPHRRHRIFVLVDQAVSAAWPSLVDDIHRYADAYHDRLQLVCAPMVMLGGEPAKNDAALVACLHADFNAASMDRHSFVLVVGGGSLLDMAGYAAATAHRGLRLIRVPTTVLAQNDAGVSVKNGINAFGKKNFLGTFSPPFAVLNDRRFLDSLSRRDRIAGMAEAVKAALIRDAQFFYWMVDRAHALESGDPESLAHLIRRCAEIHLDHIAGSGDPFEAGCGRPLDFGHWAAHKLEALTRYRLRHGEAVALGVALDTLYSVHAGFLDPQAGEATLTLLKNLGLPLWDDALANPDLLNGLTEFREHLGGELTVTLLQDIGAGFEVHAINEDLVRQSIARLYSRSLSHSSLV